jgi:prepilin-type processing-associated H-X9-DG protein/prepilin-type N-terminal cleavage/methylation domain-containing protein
LALFKTILEFHIQKSRRSAFTLIEILVVLGIISLLAALLFTAFGRVREGGRRTVCLSNHRQIMAALQLYESDSAGHFPYVVHHGLDESWVNLLLPYVQSPQVFLCPTDGDLEEKVAYGHTMYQGVKNSAVPSSYIVNEDLLRSGIVRKGPWPRLVALSRSISTVASPASTVFMSDGAQQAFPEPPYWTADVSECVASTGQLGYILREPSTSHLVPVTPMARYLDCYAPNSRHVGRANVGFVDGHVKSMVTTQWYFPLTPFLDPAKGG